MSVTPWTIDEAARHQGARLICRMRPTDTHLLGAPREDGSVAILRQDGTPLWRVMLADLPTAYFREGEGLPCGNCDVPCDATSLPHAVRVDTRMIHGPDAMAEQAEEALRLLSRVRVSLAKGDAGRDMLLRAMCVLHDLRVQGLKLGRQVDRLASSHATRAVEPQSAKPAVEAGGGLGQRDGGAVSSEAHRAEQFPVSEVATGEPAIERDAMPRRVGATNPVVEEGEFFFDGVCLWRRGVQSLGNA